MKDRCLITVIVPVYNAEKFLATCIDSILQQTYTELELLLVNDGSTDSSASICDDYAYRDARVKVLHKSNGGVSSARNLGIQEAQGEWITFVDSDDFVEHSFLQDFRDHANGEDLYICNAHKFVDRPRDLYYKLQTSSWETADFLRHYGLLLLDTPWAKFFKRSVLQANSLKFDERFHLGEDTLFNLVYIRYCARVYVNEKPYYYYRLSENNLSGRSYSFEKELFLKKQVKKEYENIVNAKGYFVDNINIARLFVAVYRNNSKKERLQMLKEIQKSFPTQMDNVFQLTFGYGALLRILLKYRLFSMFDFVYKKIR